MTHEQKEKLQFLALEMRKVAQPIGPMHSWWDDIFDIECLLRGEKTALSKTAEQWITEAEDNFTKSGRAVPSR